LRKPCCGDLAGHSFHEGKEPVAIERTRAIPEAYLSASYRYPNGIIENPDIRSFDAEGPERTGRSTLNGGTRASNAERHGQRKRLRSGG
jgi:hypothetical protein